MRIRFVWVGKTKNKAIAALIDEYVKQLGRFCPVEITVVRENKSGDEADAARIIETESEAVLKTLTRDSYTVLLDIGGNRFPLRNCHGLWLIASRTEQKNLFLLLAAF